MIKLFSNNYFFSFLSKKVGLIILLLFTTLIIKAQCPNNIDFENGNFTGWQCKSGTLNNLGIINVSNTAPLAGRHDMLSAIPGNGLDRYGLFPKNCPNGSGHSIKIGNEINGGTADAIIYSFTIPANQDKFSLIYNYAIVLNDNGHPALIQPRLNIEVKNVTDNIIDPCTSFPIVISATLPGFFVSNTRGPQNTDVRCKDWAATTINLDGHAGKTIQLSFTVTGCGASAHFGYAYIDVNTECSSSFVGATYCKDDSLVKVTAPYGYQGYRWFDINNNNLGNSQILTLQPPPLTGDSVFVELTPYNGYGCLSTITAHFKDTLKVIANAGEDKSVCASNSVQIGSANKPGFLYSWTPSSGLNDTTIANPIANPTVSTKYFLSVSSIGGGCKSYDTVNVTVPFLSDSIQLLGSSSYCNNTGKFTLLKVFNADVIQWYKDNMPISGANQTQYNVTSSGAYYCIVSTFGGCSKVTKTIQIDIFESPVSSFNINKPAQCLEGNQFVFSNTSTIAAGNNIINTWDLGNGTIMNTTDVTYSYPTSGTFKVKLNTTTINGCSNDTAFTINVYDGAKANFSVNNISQCFKNNNFIFTNNSVVTSNNIIYNWDMGDGNFFNTKNVNYNYTSSGTFNVKLITIANINCKSDSTITITVNPSPTANFTVNATTQCLSNNNFILSNNSSIASGSMTNSWSMGDGSILSNLNPTYIYTNAGNYTIKLLVEGVGSCKDSTNTNVIINATPTANFKVLPICENLTVPIYNRTFNNTTSTLQYLWNFGNGNIDTNEFPVYSYPIAGTYPISLTVSTLQCPQSFNIKIDSVVIDAPVQGIVYPTKDAAYNFPEQLQSRQIGNNVIWKPNINLNDRFSYSPQFYGITEQLYTIQLKTATGCTTIDTQFVKTHKKIEIYVPNSFTPNNDGLNDRLRPVLIGFSKVNYFNIYDRWGKLLYHINSDEPGWDGKINNVPAEIQTIVWIIEAIDVDGKIHNKKGTTVLYR